VEKLDADTVQINETITIAQHQIDLIREYRTRLIADVVTGKVDVRDIPVEDVPEDEALEEFVESREIEEALDIGEIQDAKQ
jgi:ABC-type phosphate/phosphonate transport system ATPase subunit